MTPSDTLAAVVHGVVAELRWDDAPSAVDIVHACLETAQMLVAKNKSYGDSALKPLRVFSRATAIEQIYVRLDDKLSRLSRGRGEETEDVEADILGYLILLRVAKKRRSEGGRMSISAGMLFDPPSVLVDMAKALEPEKMLSDEEMLAAGLDEAERAAMRKSYALLSKVARGEKVSEADIIPDEISIALIRKAAEYARQKETTSADPQPDHPEGFDTNEAQGFVPP
jgi:hypothetical protein